MHSVLELGCISHDCGNAVTTATLASFTISCSCGIYKLKIIIGLCVRKGNVMVCMNMIWLYRNNILQHSTFPETETQIYRQTDDTQADTPQIISFCTAAGFPTLQVLPVYCL